MNSSIRKYEDIDVKDMIYNSPVKIGSSYYASIGYGENCEPLYIQTPKIKSLHNLEHIKGKSNPYLEVEIPNGKYDIYDFFLNMDDQNMKTTFKNSKSWFKKELPLEAIDDMYKRTVQPVKKHQNPKHTGKEPYNYFMVAIFPKSQARILDYNRLIKDLYGYTPGDLIKQIKKNFTVEKQNTSFKPEESRSFGMYLDKNWYSIKLKKNPEKNLFRIINLDINILHEYLLEPILGVGDPRYDQRIDFIAGFHGLDSIEKKVNSGEAKIGFSLLATRIEDVIDFADQELTMPPKSTWFDPKPLDGLVAYDFE